MDIVERLRICAKHDPHDTKDNIFTDAAYEIERLRQQNAELVEALRRIANDQDGLDVWSLAEDTIAKATGGE